MSKKLGLALGSGGARGIAHIGFLQAMEEAGIKPDYYKRWKKTASSPIS